MLARCYHAPAPAEPSCVAHAGGAYRVDRSKKRLQVWSYLYSRQEHFLNPLYDIGEPAHQAYLPPELGQQHYKLWTGMYGRADPTLFLFLLPICVLALHLPNPPASLALTPSGSSDFLYSRYCRFDQDLLAKQSAPPAISNMSFETKMNQTRLGVIGEKIRHAEERLAVLRAAKQGGGATAAAPEPSSAGAGGAPTGAAVLGAEPAAMGNADASGADAADADAAEVAAVPAEADPLGANASEAGAETAPEEPTSRPRSSAIPRGPPPAATGGLFDDDGAGEWVSGWTAWSDTVAAGPASLPAAERCAHCPRDL